ncbi:hypothetical protein ACQY1Q_14710 [Tenacibaculum sp. TC6]|uniref:hypothetical protein n=1 Tax=Tenacibaculum sp. TC6 TaxID=3423223 RepID=UPI003D36DCAD
MGEIEILSLKLKRHNVVFSHNIEEHTLSIGKVKLLKIKYVIGVLCLSIAVLCLFLLVFLNVPFGRVINYVVSGGIGFFGLKNLIDYFNLKENNVQVLITKEGINIDAVFIAKEDILEINVHVDFEEEGNSSGYIYVDSLKGKNKLLVLIGSDYKYLKNDLLFIKQFFINFLGIKNTVKI